MPTTWEIDSAILELLESKKNFTYDHLNRLFGGNAATNVTAYPNSLRAKFYPPTHADPNKRGKGLNRANLAPGLFMRGDVDVSADIVHSSLIGVPTGWYDVSAYGAKPSASAATNYAAIKAAIDAAYASLGSANAGAIVWFPRFLDPGSPNFAESIYLVVPTVQTDPAIEIKPGLTYLGAPGVVIKRTDAVASSATVTTIFGTAAAWSGGTDHAIVRGFVVDSNGAGHYGIYIGAAGGSVLVENCRFQYAFKDTAGWQRAGAWLQGILVATIKNCDFMNCDTGILSTAGILHVRGCKFGHFAGTGAWTNIGVRGLLRIDSVQHGNGLIKACHFQGPRRAGASSDTGNKPSCINVQDGGVAIIGNTFRDFSYDYCQAVNVDNSAATHVIIDGNNISNNQPGVTAHVNGTAVWARKSLLNIITNNAISASETGQTKWKQGINTQPIAAATSGDNRIGGNMVGPAVTTPYALNSIVSATAHPDITRGLPAPMGIARTRLSKLLGTAALNLDVSGGVLSGALLAAQPKVQVKWESVAWGLQDSGQYFNDEQVLALAQFQGKLVAAGEFDASGPRYVRRLATLVGSRWEEVADLNTQPTVRAILPFGDYLWVGGQFTKLGAATGYSRFVRIDPSLKTVTQVSGGTSGPVYVIAPYQQNLFVAGSFTQVTTKVPSAIATKGFCMFSITGDEWQPPAATQGFNGLGAVYCATQHGNYLIVGGSFSTATDQAGAIWNARNIAMFSDYGTGPKSVMTAGVVGTDVGFNGAVYALAPCGEFFLAGGSFTGLYTAGTSRRHLALCYMDDDNMETSQVQGIPGTVYAIAEANTSDARFYNGKKYIIGGEGHLSVLGILPPATGATPAMPSGYSLRQVELPHMEADRRTGLKQVGGQVGAALQRITIRQILVDEENDWLYVVGGFQTYGNIEASFGQNLNQIVTTGNASETGA